MIHKIGKIEWVMIVLIEEILLEHNFVLKYLN